MKELSHLNTRKSLMPLATDWLLIAAAIAVSMSFPQTWVYVLALALIASRQHALLILVHEGVHYRLHEKRSVNDAISNLLAAYPIFFCTTGYRANHLVHHRHLNTEQDPDWMRKTPFSEWQFPQSKGRFLLTLGKVLFTSWYKLLVLFWAFSGFGVRATWGDPVKRREALGKLAFYTLGGTLIWQMGIGREFLLFWVVPYLTFFPLFDRIRSISEHFGLSYEHDLRHTRDVVCSTESFFFGPHGVNFHLAHHLFPTVPQYNLAKLHRELMSTREYGTQAHQNDGYVFGRKSVLSEIVKN